MGIERGLAALAARAAVSDATAAGVETGYVATAELRATHSVSRKAVGRLATDIEANGIKEPLKYVEHQGEKYVVDGNHPCRRQFDLESNKFLLRESLFHSGDTSLQPI